MLGEFVDDYTVKVVDVFAMPQSGTGVSVEAVDPVFQTKMLDMLKQTGRSVCFDAQTVRKLSALLQSRDGCWMVSQSSRLWVLAFWSGHQHTTGTLAPKFK